MIDIDKIRERLVKGDPEEKAFGKKRKSSLVIVRADLELKTWSSHFAVRNGGDLSKLVRVMLQMLKETYHSRYTSEDKQI